MLEFVFRIYIFIIYMHLNHFVRVRIGRPRSQLHELASARQWIGSKSHKTPCKYKARSSFLSLIESQRSKLSSRTYLSRAADFPRLSSTMNVCDFSPKNIQRCYWLSDPSLRWSQRKASLWDKFSMTTQLKRWTASASASTRCLSSCEI